jgi:hypothetical protein
MDLSAFRVSYPSLSVVKRQREVLGHCGTEGSSQIVARQQVSQACVTPFRNPARCPPKLWAYYAGLTGTLTAFPMPRAHSQNPKWFSTFRGLQALLFWRSLCLMTKIRYANCCNQLLEVTETVEAKTGLWQEFATPERGFHENARKSTIKRPAYNVLQALPFCKGWQVLCSAGSWVSSRTRGGHMNAQRQRKCAYFACECLVGGQEQYCSDYCSDADDTQETEIQCDCKHAPCALN